MMTLDFSIDPFFERVIGLGFISFGISALLALLGVILGSMAFHKAKKLNTRSTRWAARFTALNFWEPAIGLIGGISTFFIPDYFFNFALGSDGKWKFLIMYGLVFLCAPLWGLGLRNSKSRWHSVAQAGLMWSRWAINLIGAMNVSRFPQIGDSASLLLPSVIGPIWLMVTFIIARNQFKKLVKRDAQLTVEVTTSAFSPA